MDFEKARKEMVEYQIKSRGIKSPAVLKAMEKIPRHLFVPDEYQTYAYEDHPLSIGYGQTISQPYMVAIMTELLDLKPTDKVLEIGTGSGYQTSILAEIAEKVITIERISELADSAKKRLEALGYKNVIVISGDGTLGYEKEAPYDAILVTAGSPDVPNNLKNQLKDGGRLVIPVGSPSLQVLLKITKKGQEFLTEKHTSCIFVPLVGEKGWKFYEDS
ncbi:MAG: protein-L-isoaspartate(D-aspartate) O-methyltransferase [Candidatus Hydrogenedentes bacterium]|nr:protein-L-isoaspartate(D-aspartate) O-methyltransferase [Candidatus Hydrogenedentota bacterium]